MHCISLFILSRLSRFPSPRSWHKLTFLCWRAVKQSTNQPSKIAKRHTFMSVTQWSTVKCVIRRFKMVQTNRTIHIQTLWSTLTLERRSDICNVNRGGGAKLHPLYLQNGLDFWCGFPLLSCVQAELHVISYSTGYRPPSLISHSPRHTAVFRLVQSCGPTS